MPHKDPEARRAYEREYRRRWRAKHPDKVKAYNAKNCAENRDSRRLASKAWREANPEKHATQAKRHRATNKKQVYARSKIASRVAKGKWPTPHFFLCTDCDSRAIHYHHPDYNLPLWVEPLCQSCHTAIHHHARNTNAPNNGVPQQEGRTTSSLDL